MKIVNHHLKAESISKLTDFSAFKIVANLNDEVRAECPNKGTIHNISEKYWYFRLLMNKVYNYKTRFVLEYRKLLGIIVINHD